jgi:Predicted transcriptional regulator
MNLSQKIKFAMDRIEKTPTEFGKLIGVSQPMVSQYTSGERAPKRTRLAKIAEVSGLPLEFFVRDDIVSFEQYEVDKKLGEYPEKQRYLNYFVAIDKAIDGSISPDQLEDAIEFIKKARSIQK